MQTAERISSFDNSDNVIYQRHLVAYHEAKKLVKGDLLEVGCGEGYGMELLLPQVNSYTAIDKFEPRIEIKSASKPVAFHQMNLPPIKFEDNKFDSLVSFQVIEHIEDDETFIYELNRVLKPGGIAVLTTPNRLMSLTRNPWHIREYTFQELGAKLLKHFSKVEVLGVYGDEAINEYYKANKASVEKITRFDVFDLQHKLPRQVLQIPYDILNRLNRRKLRDGNNDLVNKIKWQDYSIKQADDYCFDLFVVATK